MASHSLLFHQTESQSPAWPKDPCMAGCRWLTPVILATQEAEIRRIEVQSQSKQILLETLSQKMLPEKIGLVE
jgi:hypothetical protein